VAKAGEAGWGLDLSWQRFGPGRTLGGEGSSVERQRPRGAVLAVLVMGGFVLLCCFLGLLFVVHGQPDGWFSGVGLGGLTRGMSRVEGGEKAVEGV